MVCLPFGAGYFLSYFYRSINAVISGPLAAELGLSASDLGLLTSAYFLGFAAFQLVLGVLLDHYGPRWVQAYVLLIAAVGALVFSFGTGLLSLLFARTLIGTGVAGGLMSSFKVITLWFPPERWPRVNGIFMGIGGLGAVAATTPVQAAVEAMGWRPVFQGLSLVTILVAVSILYIVPVHRSEWRSGTASLADQVRGLGRIYRDRLFWRLAPVTCVAEGAGLAIQGLWAGPWFRDVAGLDPAGVAHQLLVMTIALTAGFVATGLIAEICARFGVSKIGVVGLGAVLMMVILGLLIGEVHPRGYWVWFLFGFFSNLMVVAFPALSEHFGAEFAGRASTALNLLLFATAFAFQYLIGAVIDRFPPSASGGYASAGYQAAFAVIVALIAIAFAWYLVPGRSRPARGQG